MNIRHFLPSMSRWLLSVGPLMLAVGLQQPVHAADVDFSNSVAGRLKIRGHQVLDRIENRGLPVYAPLASRPAKTP